MWQVFQVPEGLQTLTQDLLLGTNKSFLANRNTQSSGPVGHSVSEGLRLSRKDFSIIKAHLIINYVFWEAVTSGAMAPQLTPKSWPYPEG